MAKKRKPEQTRGRVPHLTNLPESLAAAGDYLKALNGANVPFVLNPDWDERSGLVRGIDVGVDAIGSDGFGHWLVMNFREDGMHGDGYTIRHTMPGTTFERSSMSYEEMAKGLAACRTGKLRPAIVTKERSDSFHGCRPIQILEFQS